MGEITNYMVANGASGTESMLGSYDAAYIESLEKEGCSFVAVYADGTRVEVAASDVSKPITAVQASASLADPSYVNERISVAIDCLEALAESVSQSNSGGGLMLMSVSDGGSKTDPMDRFDAAIAELKALVSER